MRDITIRTARSFANRLSPHHVVLGLMLLLVLAQPAVAQAGNEPADDTSQSTMGSVFCGTSVETGINLLFGGLAALGLPAGMIYVGRSGLKYMRAKGNPDQRNEARRDLMMSGIGFGILIAAIIAPEVVSKVGSQMGFGFSQCVTPF